MSKSKNFSELKLWFYRNFRILSVKEANNLGLTPLCFFGKNYKQTQRSIWVDKEYRSYTVIDKTKQK